MAYSRMKFYALVIVLNLQAYACMRLLRDNPHLSDTSLTLFSSGSALISMVLATCYFGAHLLKNEPGYVTLFFLFTIFSANIDLYICLSLAGLSDIGNFYVETGEEYFKSTWGWGSLLWDATAHYILQIIIAHALIAEEKYPRTMLFWCGSIINSMPCLLIGAASGEYSDRIHFAIIFNYPYVLVPLFVMLNILRNNTREVNRTKMLSMRIRICEFLLSLANLTLLCWHVLRGLSLFNSKIPFASKWLKLYEPEIQDAFAKPQVMQNLFTFSYWHIFSIIESLYRAILGYESSLISSRMDMLSMFAAGVTCQGQFCHFMTLLFEWNQGKLLSRVASPVALTINLFFVISSIVQAHLWNSSRSISKANGKSD